VLAAAPPVEHCLIGSGRDPGSCRATWRRFAEQGIGVETMTTGAAVRPTIS
jgi:uncharacterized protein